MRYFWTYTEDNGTFWYTTFYNYSEEAVLRVTAVTYSNHFLLLQKYTWGIKVNIKVKAAKKKRSGRVVVPDSWALLLLMISPD